MLCSIPVSLFMFCVYKSVSFHNKIGLLGTLVGSIVLQTKTLLGYITGQTHLTTRARPIRDLSERLVRLSPNKLCWLDQFWHSRPFPTSWVARSFGCWQDSSQLHTFGGSTHHPRSVHLTLLSSIHLVWDSLHIILIIVAGGEEGLPLSPSVHLVTSWASIWFGDHLKTRIS